MPTSIRLEPEITRRLDQLAAATGRTKAFYLREIIARGIGDVEEYYLAAKVAEDIRSGREQTFTLDEVVRRLGLAD